MNNWRDQILKEFAPQVTRLTLVADPDGLLLEEGVLHSINELGFELIPFEDHIAFRYAYESKYRSSWDNDETTDLVVVLRAQSSDLDNLPYDLLQAGRKLSFNLGELFPNLSYPVVAELDVQDLDKLYLAQLQHKPGIIGDNATKEFALRHVFEIAPELIKQPSDLMRVLLRRHYRGQRIPGVLDQRFIQVLRQKGLFEEWPLNEIVSDREVFFAFLQERWPVFLNRMEVKDQPDSVNEMKAVYDLHFSGPADLPFEHDDVRVYIDNLFIEGLLSPVSHENADDTSSTWAAIGVLADPATNQLSRMNRLLDKLHDTVPAGDARHSDWFRFGYSYSELSILVHKLGSSLPGSEEARIEELRSSIDGAFLDWVQSRYGGLHNQPPEPPAMLHHIPKMLARNISDSQEKKIAFLLMDGMALDQWLVLRDAIQTRRRDLFFRESAVFAWMPTITSVSRQAAFAGKPPIYFPGSITRTDKDESLWKQFWADHGLTGSAAAYARGVGDGDLPRVQEILSHPKIRAVGLVIDKIDKIMHGMELGATGMLGQVQQWGMQGFLSDLIDVLLENGFQIFLSSDHGNIEAEGIGRPAEGAVADVRGERVRVYPDELLRASVLKEFPEAIEWPAIGLPDDYFALLAPYRKAFIRKDEIIVSHGGISIEELIVPLVQIEQHRI